MDLTCGTEDNVITKVEFAAWGVADTQPAWDFTDQPGLCGMGVMHTNWNVSGFSYLPSGPLMTEIKEQCVGMRKCRLRPISQDHGEASCAG